MRSAQVFRASGFKASETLLGIETQPISINNTNRVGFKASETLLGIETNLIYYHAQRQWSFKASETLLGIETIIGLQPNKLKLTASKPLKPF